MTYLTYYASFISGTCLKDLQIANVMYFSYFSLYLGCVPWAWLHAVVWWGIELSKYGNKDAVGQQAAKMANVGLRELLNLVY